ncbi:thioesterase family protein [Nakamurella sp. PAMC28650]|uniref:thioesterase family protein n=1 Tax=Nakamurella sp. PAMC28650 TaxID=2762325 RepID=UPI00164D61BE|nr:thioesterase family protein [Nakamurella sp. PAMC28650]QNK79785.1 thioesterase family protein [Nakamurella sp. PAMC28650]
MNLPTAVPPAYYLPLGDGRYLSTEHSQGAWSSGQQHMAPVSGLIAHVLESCSPRTDLAMSRVAYDILGSIPSGEVEVTARVVRPGRTIELLEAEMTAGGRPVVRAVAWRLAVSDTSAIAATDLGRIPGPDEAEPFPMAGIWPGGFIRSLEARRLGGHVPGRSTVWVRPGCTLLDGEPTSDLARFFGVIDTANGVAVRAMPGEVMFPNTDLTVHLFRRPTGIWVGMETDVSFGADGLGLTSSVLHDLDGPIGRSAQTLTVRPLA